MLIFFSFFLFFDGGAAMKMFPFFVIPAIPFLLEPFYFFNIIIQFYMSLFKNVS